MFDLTAWWTGASRRVEAEIFTGSATLRLSREGRRRLARLGVEQARIAAQADATAGDGRADVTMPIESVGHAAMDFQRLGAEAEVLAPVTLRSEMRDAALRLAALYRD